MSFILKSHSFREQGDIPRIYSGEGQDISPQLEWEDPPKNTQAFALICDDPDAPREKPWVHWLLYDIPASVHSIPENLPKAERIDDLQGAAQGQNNWNRIGYGGPMPPPGHGVHHYHFKLYALDQPIHLQPGATKEKLESAMSGHILGKAELVGTYQR